MNEARGYCTNCGRALDADAQFCSGCGQTVAGAGTESSQAEATATPHASAASAQPAQSSGSGSPNVALWVILGVVVIGLVVLLVGGLVLGWFVLRGTSTTQVTRQDTQATVPLEPTEPAISTTTDSSPRTDSSPTTATSPPQAAPKAVVVETPTTVVVPNVIGMSSVDAEEQLETTGGFRVIYNQARYSDQYSRNNIISQHPKGGAIAQSGDVVYIVKSRGPAPAPPARQQPTRRQTVTGSAFNGSIAPYTSTRQIKDWEMQQCTNWVLTLIRNEIYARHGRPFQNQRIRAYFNNQSWYQPNRNFSESWLSAIEKQNAARIAAYQKRRYGKSATQPGAEDLP